MKYKQKKKRINVSILLNSSYISPSSWRWMVGNLELHASEPYKIFFILFNLLQLLIIIACQLKLPLLNTYAVICMIHLYHIKRMKFSLCSTLNCSAGNVLSYKRCECDVSCIYDPITIFNSQEEYCNSRG